MKDLGVRGISAVTIFVLFLLAAALGPYGISSVGMLIGIIAGVVVALIADRYAKNHNGFYSTYAALGTVLLIVGIITLIDNGGERGALDIAIGASMMVFGLRNRPR